MIFTLRNNGNQTFSVLAAAAVVFTGTMAEAMAEHKRLSLAAKPAPVAWTAPTSKMDRRAERKQAGMR